MSEVVEDFLESPSLLESKFSENLRFILGDSFYTVEFLLHCLVIMYSLILYGRRSIELQKKWRTLKPFQYVSATAAADVSLRDGRNRQNFAVSYLAGSLGLTTKLAESISKRVSFEDERNPESFLNLFKSHGFSDLQHHYGLSTVDADKSLGPKLQFLQSRGASTSELTQVASTVPKILGKREGKSSSAYYDFIKEIIEADKSSNFQKLCHSFPEGSNQENKIRNMLVLRELGMPQKLLFSMLTSSFAAVCGKERFEESLKKVVEMGFDPKTSRFVTALNLAIKQ